jgi:hypothetical protein
LRVGEHFDYARGARRTVNCERMVQEPGCHNGRTHQWLPGIRVNDLASIRTTRGGALPRASANKGGGEGKSDEEVTKAHLATP